MLACRSELCLEDDRPAEDKSIRQCAPKTLDEWREYYLKNVRPKEHIESLGKKLYIKITEVIQSEVEEITEQDCIDYIRQLVIDRTFDGYMTEIKTIYGQLEKELGVKKGNNFQTWNNRVNRMSADFVVCNKDSSIVAVVELDDESHEREDRKTADSKKNKALSSAGIPIVRWQVKMLPDEPKIKASILPNPALKGDVPKAARPLV